jgi:hypothetical protein
VVAAALGLAALGAAGCAPDVNLPTPPNQAQTAALVAVYQMPTATLDPAAIDQVSSDAQARLADLPLDWLPDLISNLLVTSERRLEDGGLPDDPATMPDESRAELTASVEVHRICPGWSDPPGPPDEAQNGAVDLTAIVDTGRLNPELWGTGTACKVRVPPAASAMSAISVVTPPPVLNVTFDGTLIVYSLGPLPRTPAQSQFLLTFDGMITINGQTKSLSFDFQVQNGSVEFRVPVGNGDAIVSVGATLGIRGANASYSCDPASQSCVAAH